jgi:hypothetical protein
MSGFRLGFLTHLQGRGDPAATYRADEFLRPAV